MTVRVSGLGAAHIPPGRAEAPGTDLQLEIRYLLESQETFNCISTLEWKSLWACTHIFKILRLQICPLLNKVQETGWRISQLPCFCLLL